MSAPWKNVARVSMGTISAQGLALLVTPLLTRLYAPDDFGLLAVFVGTTAVIGMIGAGRWEYAIPLAREPRDAVQLGTLALATLLITTSGIALALLLARGPLLGLFSAGALAPIWWCIPLGAFGTAAYQVMSMWVVRHRAYGVIAGTTFTRSLSQNVTQIALAPVTAGSGLVLGQLVGQWAGCLRLWRSGVRQDLKDHRPSIPGLRETAAEYWRFPVFNGSSSLFNILARHLPALLIAGMYGMQWAGWYALAERVVAQPMRAVGTAASQVFYGDASTMLRTGRRDEVRRRFLLTSLALAGIGIGVAAVLIIWSVDLFVLVFGEPWAAAGSLAAVLSVAMAFQLAISPVSQTLTLIKRQEWLVVLDLTRLLMTAGAIYFVWRAGGSAPTTVAAYAGALSLSYAMVWGVSWWQLGKPEPGPDLALSGLPESR